MNEVGYRKLAFFFIKGFALMLCLIVALFLFIAYALIHVLLLYYLSVGFLALITYLGFSLWIDYHIVRDMNWQSSIEKLELSTLSEEETLKICEFWVNGATYSKIAEDFHLANDTSVSREIKKGIRQLLKEHKNNSD